MPRVQFPVAGNVLSELPRVSVKVWIVPFPSREWEKNERRLRGQKSSGFVPFQDHRRRDFLSPAFTHAKQHVGINPGALLIPYRESRLEACAMCEMATSVSTSNSPVRNRSGIFPLEYWVIRATAFGASSYHCTSTRR